jgi:hypothetical protein
MAGYNPPLILTLKLPSVLLSVLNQAENSEKFSTNQISQSLPTENTLPPLDFRPQTPFALTEKNPPKRAFSNLLK